jgi:anti-sigma factor RsiW
VNGYKYDGFEHAAALVRAGEAVTRAALPEIRRWLQSEPASARAPRKSAAVNPVAMTGDSRV